MNDDSHGVLDMAAFETDDTHRVGGIIHKMEDLLHASWVWIAIGVVTVTVLILTS